MNQKKFLFLIFLGFIVGLGFWFSISYDNKSTDKNGFLKAEITGPLKSEIENILARIQSEPDNTELLNSLADLYFRNGNYDFSEETFKKVLDKKPDNVSALNGLANVLRYRGKYEESETMFKKAISIQPGNSWLYLDLGKLYRNWNKHKESEEAFEKAISLNPDDDKIYSYGLGYLYRDEGRLEDALKMFRKAVDLNPSSFNYMGLGDIYRHLTSLPNQNDI